MFTAQRTVRDGYLIAYEGEQMSEEEAAARGLIEETENKPIRRAKKQSVQKSEEAVEDED